MQYFSVNNLWDFVFFNGAISVLQMNKYNIGHKIDKNKIELFMLYYSVAIEPYKKLSKNSKRTSNISLHHQPFS